MFMKVCYFSKYLMYNYDHNIAESFSRNYILMFVPTQTLRSNFVTDLTWNLKERSLYNIIRNTRLRHV